MNVEQQEKNLIKKKELILKKRQQLDEELAIINNDLSDIDKYKKEMERIENLRRIALEKLNKKSNVQ